MNSLRRALLVSLAAVPWLAACGRKPRLSPVPAGATVLALGDSLTFGTGAALERLPALLREHSPRLVLLGIGGNDFLRRMPAGDTRANIRAICTQAAATGTQVVLIAIPHPA